jgi:serine/threonine-protein kinase
VAIVLAALGLHATTDFVGTLERRYYDFASTSSSRLPSDRIAVIAIDDQSIANIGRWPWSRDVHAKLIDKLAAAQARTIVHTAFFFEPQADKGLSYIRKLKSALVIATESGADYAQLGPLIAEAELALDTDAALADSMKRAGNVLIPSFYYPGEQRGKSDSALPAFAKNSSIGDPSVLALSVNRGQQPIDLLGDVAAGVGHMMPVQDVDGALRQEALLVNYFGQAVPALALLTAAKSLNLSPADIRINPGESVQLGKLRIDTDDKARFWPQFYGTRDGKNAFVADSAYDVLTV